MRLNRFLANAGVASRRKSDLLIKTGRISVNGKVTYDYSFDIDPEVDTVTLDGRPVYLESKHTYIIINKPAGYIVSVGDTHNRKTVLELLPVKDRRLFPVGRLDMDTEGVLLLTDDGELCYRLTHPRYMVGKKYHAEVRGVPDQTDLQTLRDGVDLGEGRTSPAEVRVEGFVKDNAVLEITVHEGKKRQIKRMCEAVGHPIFKLRRVDFAGIGLVGLSLGQYRYLTEDEVDRLKRKVGLLPE